MGGGRECPGGPVVARRMTRECLRESPMTQDGRTVLSKERLRASLALRKWAVPAGSCLTLA